MGTGSGVSWSIFSSIMACSASAGENFKRGLPVTVGSLILIYFCNFDKLGFLRSSESYGVMS